ncbi:hypothetical protein N7532_009613 [Penicillium argentinense]|uniref:Alpha/beta hydrolase fold-3 domain-containing protein n=1 Tax=Penicillium argentinense TaxID=1131581 RepID=A0A9W9K2Q1_9EURO|nr:uncharacterized protein N7532_009613 [Penicillium argentinense]KAJ5090929.1 hypothetical protein N7532_009613 [Penicillium argentinense]
MSTTHTYKVVGDLALSVDITKPPNFSQDDPLVLHFHGGYLMIGEKSSFPPYWLINACRHRNWAYATASYRLLPEASGLDMLSDSRDVTQWIYDNITTNIIIAGSSAGGYLAFATAALPESPPIRSLLTVCGGFDFSRPKWIQPQGRPEDIAETIDALNAAIYNGHPVDSHPIPIDHAAAAQDKRIQLIKPFLAAAKFPEALLHIPDIGLKIISQGLDTIPVSHRALFPLAFGVTDKFPPTVLIHGDQDVMVEFEESTSAAEKLKEVGVKFILERAEGCGHGFDVQGPIDLDAVGSDEPMFYVNLRRGIEFLEQMVA